MTSKADYDMGTISQYFSRHESTPFVTKQSQESTFLAEAAPPSACKHLSSVQLGLRTDSRCNVYLRVPETLKLMKYLTSPALQNMKLVLCQWTGAPKSWMQVLPDQFDASGFNKELMDSRRVKLLKSGRRHEP